MSIILNGKRFCPQCRQWKSIEGPEPEFHREARRDGWASCCKACRKKYKEGRV